MATTTAPTAAVVAPPASHAREFGCRSYSNKRVVVVCRAHEPLAWRRWLGAVVEDEVLVVGADRERRGKPGRGVGRRDAAPFGASSRIEICKPWSIREEQGAVVVEDAEDLQGDLALRKSEARDGVIATNLEPNPDAAAGLRGALRDKPKREGDLHVTA
jgi:hypothetical protein|uniref:Uncharacterized protein n=1 Tax=Zea mays TaxID=4577 RepID=A0A804LCL2_MAIZE